LVAVTVPLRVGPDGAGDVAGGVGGELRSGCEGVAVMNASIGTQPDLALRTRRGTGYYKVPSLRGVWTRQMFGHSGYVRTLEDWFDPARVRPDYSPTGFRPPGVTRFAVTGHLYGLELSASDRARLIAFLKTID
jgi:hypothetical protein